MTKFEDKNIIKDPVDELDRVKKPNESREGPLVNLLHSLRQKRSGGSYHNQDPKQGHLSAADGCSRRNYLNYIHKLDDNLEPPQNTPDTNWTFHHGDLIHEGIQDLVQEELGEKHVTKEETVEFEVNGEYQIFGHSDLVLRGLDNPDKVKKAIPADVDLLPDDFNGFPDPFVIDIKTTSEFTYYAGGGHARSIPKESNLMQLNGYMGILGASFGSLLYYSKRNDYIEEYWVEFDEQLFQQAQDNIKKVLDAVNNGNPPERDSEEYLCNNEYCKYYREGLCPGVDSVEDPDNLKDDIKERFTYEKQAWD